MKKPIVQSSSLLMLLILSLMIGFVSAGCEKPKDNQNIVNNLEGTSWKLAKFVQTSAGTTKIPEPEDMQCYWISFNSDTTFSGKTSTNSIVGKYHANFQTLTFSIINMEGTEINELFDGPLYVEDMLSICSFELTNEVLKLYYNKTDYLLFNIYSSENE